MSKDSKRNKDTKKPATSRKDFNGFKYNALEEAHSATSLRSQFIDSEAAKAFDERKDLRRLTTSVYMKRKAEQMTSWL